jgi:hypothetical protein
LATGGISLDDRTAVFLDIDLPGFEIDVASRFREVAFTRFCILDFGMGSSLQVHFDRGEVDARLVLDS